MRALKYCTISCSNNHRALDLAGLGPDSGQAVEPLVDVKLSYKGLYAAAKGPMLKRPIDACHGKLLLGNKGRAHHFWKLLHCCWF